MKKNEKPRALVIDDNPVTFMILEEMLYMVDCHVDYAEDGRTGIRFLQKSQYDIVFLDYKMPGINGETVQKIVKRTCRELPIIMLSGNLTKDRVIRLKQNGVRGFIAKPFESDTIYNMMERVFKREINPEKVY